MGMAVQKAKKNSVGIITVHHCNHIGRLSNYVTIATGQNMIGIVIINGTRVNVAPYGGCEPRLSTNPICIAIPTKTKPLILDMSSGVVCEGKVRVRRNAKKNVPVGWLINRSAKPITNPLDFYGPPRQSILPLGGIAAHKGFGLGFMFDILAGGLSRAGCSNNGDKRIGNAIFMEAIKISSFIPLRKFYLEVEKFIDFVKSSKVAPGFKEILLPGEPENRITKERNKMGIFIDDETLRQIKNRTKELKINI
jgi:hydroxycarboxylate dehydrogenase B